MADSAPGGLPPDEIGEQPGTSQPIVGTETAEPGMWLTASAWLPAALLGALTESASADNDHALAVAFRQAGPIDEMPPGPVLTAFLSECSAPASEPDPSESEAFSTQPSAQGCEPDAPASQDADSHRTGPSSAEPQPAGTPGPPRPEALAARIAGGSGLAERDDTALLGLIRGWRKVASLAAAAE